MIEHRLIPQQDGSFVDWWRNVSINGIRGEGPAFHYSGEALEVVKLVLKYTSKPGDQE